MIFKRCFRGRFCKGNEHLWHHVNAEVVDFHTPTYERETGVAIDVLQTGSHPRMLLYMLDELFYVYKRVGVNDVDRQHVVTYEILTVALFRCTKQHGSQKECYTPSFDCHATPCSRVTLL